MSATAVVEINKPSNADHRQVSDKDWKCRACGSTNPKRNSRKCKRCGAAKPLGIRRPSDDLLYMLDQVSIYLLREGYDYDQSQALFRVSMLRRAGLNAGLVKTKAAEILGISRDHFRDYYNRGAELVKR